MNANVYAPPKAPVADIDASNEMVLAGRGMRFLAAIIDGIIVGIFTYLPLLLSGDIQSAAERFQQTQNPADLLAGFAGTGVMLSGVGFIIWCVITYILVQRNGQTIAKKLLNIKVVRGDGTKASVGRIFWLRNFVNALIG